MTMGKKRRQSNPIRRLLRPWDVLAKASLATGLAVAIASCSPDTAPELSRAAVVELTPQSATISAVGETARFRAIVRDQHGEPFAGPVVWSGDEHEVFSVDADGNATALGAGVGNVRATVGGVSATAVIRVAGAIAAGDQHGGVCGRTPQVRDAIMADLGMEDCGAVTDEQLATISYLDLSGPRVLASVAPCGQREKKRYPTPDEIVRMEHYKCDGSSVLDGFAAVGNDGSVQPGPLDPVVTLKADDFKGLSGLGILDLQRNHLVTLPEGVFDGLSSLQLLRMNSNRLTTLPEGVFDDLTSLQYLEMQSNRLTSLPDGVFDDLGTLTGLFLYRNAIATVPDGAFDSLGELQLLFLSSNNIEALPDGVFDSLANLEDLDLETNKITSLPEGVFDSLGELQLLYLQSNEIEALPDGVFDSLANLETLYLYYNEIEALPDGVFDSLANLEDLDLETNKITSLPEGVFDNLSGLETLWLNGNRLTSLPEGVFDGLSRLRRLFMHRNPGSPFPFVLELQRTDNDDALAPGPATVSISVALGAPLPMEIGLATSGADAPEYWLAIGVGETRSSEIQVHKPNGSGSAFSVRTTRVPKLPECDWEEGCYVGITVLASDPLVLANPRQIRVKTPVVYLNQAAQNQDGTVPLIAGRQAILRVFATSDDVNNLQPTAKAMFYRGGEMVHSVDLDAPPNGIPTEVDESRLTRSFNAMVPGEVLMPGTRLVVDLDTEGTLPLVSGSVTRVPEAGTMPLNVIEVPPFNITIVPIHYAWDRNAVSNDGVLEVSRNLAETMPEDLLYATRTVLPVRELNLTLREPYYTWADTMPGSGDRLLEEVELLRHLEAAGTAEYYHGLLAWPRYSTWQSWGFWGIAADIPSFTALTLSHLGDGSVFGGLASTFAHELGHNLSLWHAPCGGAGGPDPDYPYPEASIGTWGYDFGMTGQSGTLVNPMESRDHMSYCGPEWVSDYYFAKSLIHRATYGWPAAQMRRGPARRTLLLSGGVHDGTIRLGSAFVWRAQPKLPQRGGRYSVTGFDTSGRELFSLSFEPGAPNDLGGQSFLFAVPYRPEWDQSLERIVLRGPEGFVEIDRPTIDQTAVVADRASGRIRSIVPNWSGDVPAAMGRAAQFRVVRGLQGMELR